MSRKLLNVLLIVVLMSTVLAVLPVSASVPLPEDTAVPTIAKRPPIAISTIKPAGIRLARPRAERIEAQLRGEGVIPLNATTEQIQAAVDDYYENRFAKMSIDWVSPRVEQQALQREAELAKLYTENAPAGALAVQPVTATVFVLAVDFGAVNEAITLPVLSGTVCITQTLYFTGPLKGEIPQPDPHDNFSIWYSPTQVADVTFYNNLVFGYEGIGRVRNNLTDPHDGLPGINLAGYTVQDYYDHVAGDGNVYITGTIDGWITLDHSEAYYGANQCGNPNSIGGGVPGVPMGQAVVDAINVYSETHPAYYTDTSADAFWPKYDANHDGTLDTMWIIYSGIAEESGGGPLGGFALWSHSWSLSSQGWYPNGYKVYEGDVLTTTDDIYVDPYTMQPESLDLGVVAEEFGHNFFGLPDLYVTDGAQNSVGFWNIMSNGAWGGPLGGAKPAGMPLWFRMIAQCGQDVGGNPIFCNWQEPMVTRDYMDPAADITISYLEKTPAGVDKGIRINLPDVPEYIPNHGGTGKGAYARSANNVDLTLDRQIPIGASANGILTMTVYWDAELDYDYGYVMVNDVLVHDTTGFMTDANPNGGNLGWGLTGQGSGTLSFDLSAYAGTTIKLSLRHVCDSGTNSPGVWVDNVTLDGVLLDNFEAATAPGTFPNWTNSEPGWQVVPVDLTHESYYLVEWRTATKYDSTFQDPGGYAFVDPLHVERIPYNIPGALLYYRNAYYPHSLSQRQNYADPPSYGPKTKLLVVDMNSMPLRMGETPETYQGIMNSRQASYDAALTLQSTEGFTITAFQTGGRLYVGPWYYPPQPAVTNFNDAKGYYPGFYTGTPCTGSICYTNRDGSVVIPARNLYSTRITTFDETPYLPYYDFPLSWWGLGDSWFGSGNPGDDNVQYGVNIELLSKAPDDSTATLRVYNQAVTFDTTYEPDVVSAHGVYTVTYTTIVANEGGSVAPNVGVTYTLDAALTFVTMTQEVEPGGTFVLVGAIDPDVPSWQADNLYLGDVVTLTVVATGVADTPEIITTQVDAFDGVIARGPWYLHTDIQVGPDVWVTKAGPTTANLGDVVTFTVNYGNSGNMPAHDVAITDTVMVSGTLAWQGAWPISGTLAAGSAFTMYVPITITVSGMTVTNNIEIVTSDTELDYDNNTDTTETWVEAVTPPGYKIYLPIIMKNS